MNQNVVLITGDGIGPEITSSVCTIFKEAGVPISWIEAPAGLRAYEDTGNPLPEETLNLIKEHKIALKAPLTTPVGKGFRSANVTLRQTLDLYANVRPVKSLPGVQTAYPDVDIVTFRENTQGLYIGHERVIDPDNVELIGLITRKASERIIRAACEYATKYNLKKVTLGHKANILKESTGLFLKIGYEVAKEYPKVEFSDMIIDNMAMQLVMRPQQFDVIVTTNLFGDIMSDLASGLVGGLGVTPGANIGENYAVFEAVHGSAPDIAGQNKANPTALLFSALMMLRHLDMNEHYERIHAAALKTLADTEVRTADLGGKGTTASFTEALCRNLN
ncbi:isocitrate dehydrogenase (NAD+) [Cyclonatronum proteinivorum]|uniref:Isocitrate dehydrogenase (NAD+) n=1 Tax=Cyclonatronum proteinivorum TaxID=1457365 RepID=A0A345UK00_9BACT|nr:isocitrate/isopropylmalate dehydrogenase family protein [Cyclonatronum proteinivorum]AXJ00802.1 isocitrate dehydrogenase (NAD+) [Cyclonatronum proteinivorum]